MKTLFEELKLKNLTARNRILRSTTWEGVAEPDGSVMKEAYTAYAELARGGVGGIITGFTSVSSDDRYFVGMMRLSSDALIPQYAELVDVIHENGCPVMTQLALGGFYANQGGTLLQKEPTDMTVDEIHEVVRWFAEAAARAQAAGFDGAQIHAAHFFFLSRFISPAVNHRSDEYGGTTLRRARILKEILQAMRESAPDLNISIKINCSDFMPGGLTEDESLEICRMLADEGIDSIEVSGNGTSVPGIKPFVDEGYFMPFGDRLAAEVDVPVIVVGGMRSKKDMEHFIQDTGIAMVSMSRPLIREPALPQRMHSGLQNRSACISCNKCYSTPFHQCVFR